MLKLIPALYALVFTSLAHAAEAEPPLPESNTTGIVVFVVIVIACFVAFGWMTMKNDKKPDEEKLGDKF
jgi:predicted permease